MEFDSHSINKLKYNTPFFLFSKKRINDSFQDFRKCFPTADIHYAMKANSEPEILKILADMGANFEVASIYELNLLKKIKVSAKKIIYGTSIKPLSHIKNFFKYGVDIFSVDSFQELEKISIAAPGSKVYVRVSVNDTDSVFRFSEKFGTHKENILPLFIKAKEFGLKPYGISFHVGSQSTNIKAWGDAITNLKPIVKELEKNGIKIEIMNIGGGYPCAYASTQEPITLQDIAKNTLSVYKKLSYKQKLILEPGRGIIASTGIVVTSVIGRVERNGNHWLFLDVGVYNGLFEAMAYQGSTRYKISSLRESGNSGETLFSLAGPTGDSPDIITREALLPSDIDIGDKIIIHDVGAYSLVAVSPFNGFPKPKVYFV